MVYDAADELVLTVSPSRRRVAYTYDPRGQLASSTDETGGVSRFAYDAYGRLTTVADPRGHTLSYSYDELHRPTLKRDPLGQASAAVYDAVGNLVRLTDRMGRQTDLTYDALDRLSRAAYTDAVATYAYDAAGRPTRIDDTQSGFIEWAYDDANRLLQETTPQGSVAHAYNDAGQRASLTVADRQPVAYAYDAAGRLHTITQGPEVFTYAYDALSRPTALNRPNGVNTTYAYDPAGKLLRLRHANAAGQPVEDFRYGYDEDDEISNISSLLNAAPLPQAKNAATADAANRVAQFGPASYAFNAEGQTTSKTDAQGTATYLWDARGRLTRVMHTNAPPVSYTYDPLGRRSARTESGATTDFLYDGNDVVLDRAGGGAVIDYLNGPSIDNKLRQTSTVTSPLYFLQDHLGSTAALTGATGNLVEPRQYDAYGDGPGSVLTRYGYTGRELDELTGLYHYRARWYDAQAGRFLSEDPIGFEGGTNFYAYVENSPTNFTDPLGLEITVQYHQIRYLGILPSFFYHTSIRITPDNQAKYASESNFQNIDSNGKRYATLSAEPNIFLRLHSEVNRDSDVGQQDGKSSLGRCFKNEDELIDKLLNLDTAYRDKLPYAPYPILRAGPGYNSNSYVSGLLGAAGLPMPTLPWWLSVPGLNKPVPQNFFK
jgi:RHS repeat-associated protein